jgi:hypothetical protein
MVVGNELAARKDRHPDRPAGPGRDEPADDILELAESGMAVIFVRDLVFAEDRHLRPRRPDAVLDDVAALGAGDDDRRPGGRNEDPVSLDRRVENAGQPGDIRPVELAAAGIPKVVSALFEESLDFGPSPGVFGPGNGLEPVDLRPMGFDDRLERSEVHFFFTPPRASFTPSSNGSVRMGTSQPSGLSA